LRVELVSFFSFFFSTVFPFLELNWEKSRPGQTGQRWMLQLELRFCFSALGNGKRILLSVDVSVIALELNKSKR